MRALLVFLLFLPLAACDAGDPDGPGASSFSCEPLYGDELASGSFAATVDGTPLAVDCVTAVAQGAVVPTLDVTGYVHAGGGLLPDALVNITLIGPAVGTYDVASGGTVQTIVSGQYQAPGSLDTFLAETGTITVSELTDTRVRGSFSFVAENGAEVTGGAFDLEYATFAP